MSGIIDRSKPLTTFPCGDYDPSRGNLWAAVKHARGCERPACCDFLHWFEGFRYRWLEANPPSAPPAAGHVPQNR
jgi:hypothetical protein